MTSVHELMPTHGAVAACQALARYRAARPRATASQRRATFVGPMRARQARPLPPMALDVLENQALLDTLNSERFVDTAPATVHATLLDEGRYLGSVRTMYRLLARTGGSRERRNRAAKSLPRSAPIACRRLDQSTTTGELHNPQQQPKPCSVN